MNRVGLRDNFLRGACYLRLAQLYSKILQKTPSYVRVLNMHNTPSKMADNFRRQLEWTKKYFCLLTPTMFKGFLKGSINLARPGVLFTFDDGYEIHHSVVAPILEQFGCRGIFFVSPGLMTEYLQQNEQGKYSGKNVTATQRYIFMKKSWYAPIHPEQIISLDKKGHEIGYHTYSHRFIKDIPEKEKLYDLCTSNEIVEKLIGKTIESFAWPHSYKDIDLHSFSLIRKHYRYSFVPLSGITVPHQNEHLIFRTNVEFCFDMSKYKSLLLGVDDIRVIRKRHRLKKLGCVYKNRKECPY